MLSGDGRKNPTADTLLGVPSKAKKGKNGEEKLW